MGVITRSSTGEGEELKLYGCCAEADSPELKTIYRARTFPFFNRVYALTC